MTELTLAHWQVWALVVATSLTAGTVRGFTGFGGPAIMVVVLTQFYAPASVLALVLLVDYAANMQLFPAAVRHAAWRSLLPLVVATSIAIPFGVQILQGMDPLWLKRGIALLVGACTFVMLANWRYRREGGSGHRSRGGCRRRSHLQHDLHRAAAHDLLLRRPLSRLPGPGQRHLLGLVRLERHDPALHLGRS